MTDEERADRVAALAARRAASSPSTSPSSSPSSPRKRRGHAAAGGRVLALGLSAGAAVAFAAAMANAQAPATGAPVAPSEPASFVVRVVMANGQTTDTVLTNAPAVAVAPVTAPAIAKSRAS